MASCIVIDYVLLAPEVAHEFTCLGLSVHRIKPPDLTVAVFKRLCVEVKPLFLFSINFSPELALLASHEGLQYISWTIDPLPVSRLQLFPGSDSGLCRIFVHDRELIKSFEQLGIARSHITYLPLATSERRQAVRDPGVLQNHRCDISFVGQSLIAEKMSACGSVAQLLRNYPDKFGNRDVVGALEELNNFCKQLAVQDADAVGSFPVTRDSLIEVLPAWFARGLDSGIDQLARAHNLDWLAGWVAHESRRYRIEKILEHASRCGWRVKVYGDEGWRSIAGDAYCEFAEHYETLNAIYSASRVNLDLPRTYQRTVVTLRVFDVLACGGFLLTEFSEALSELCEPGQHLEYYHSTPHLIKRIEDALALPEDRLEAIATKGRAHVLSQHTLKQRVRQLVEGIVSSS